MREFSTGATRDNADWKFELQGFMSARVPELFGAYMHFHRRQADGKLRDADNWKKGIPTDVLESSLTRHFFEWLKAREQTRETGDSPKFDPYRSLHAALGMYFNLQGWLHDQARLMEHQGVNYRALIEQQAAEVRQEEKALAAQAASVPVIPTGAIDRLRAAAEGANVPTGMLSEPIYHSPVKPRDDGPSRAS